MQHPLDTLERAWTLHLIHHSHTDLGYTDRQELVTRRHVGFVRDALAIAEAARSGVRPEWRGFAWTCEAFWAVERFLELSTADERERLAAALYAGDLEVTAGYLNLTELAGADELGASVERAVDFGRALGVPVRSAMTADVNGHPWGYAQVLAEAGVEHLLTCVHALHGTYPLGRLQVPFWWETPGGQRLLVWNGDHYHLGNALGLVPGAVLVRMIADGSDRPPAPEDHLAFAEARMGRYLAGLEAEDHPFDEVPIVLSGLATDNGPPNGDVAAFAHLWNERHGSRVRLLPTTPTPFFERIRAVRGDEIPTHRGDWPDWWSDGCASTPRATRLFRDAQRTLATAAALDDGRGVVAGERLRALHDELILFAEHTWGHFASVATPWALPVHALAARKEAHAAAAHRLAHDALDEVVARHGAAPLRPGRPFRYAVLNQHPREVDADVALPLEPFEAAFATGGRLEVVDEASGGVLAHQVTREAYAPAVRVALRFGAGERRTVELRAAGGADAPQPSSRPRPLDRVRDLDARPDLSGWGREPVQRHGSPEQARVGEGFLVTSTVELRWDRSGIVTWRDRASGGELLDLERERGGFVLIHERTPMRHGDQLGVRARMGRNRKGAAVVRDVGRLAGLVAHECGPVFARAELAVELPGVRDASLVLTASTTAPRVDVALRFDAHGSWEPENVYVSVPFGGRARETWVEKAGVPYRPGIDQLPGTLLDFTCVGAGVSFLSEALCVAVAPLDAPLVQLGPLAHGPRRLHGDREDGGRSDVHGWLLTNVWETNFAATFGGFHEFRYAVGWTGGGAWTPEEAAGVCRALASAPVVVRLGDERQSSSPPTGRGGGS